MLKILNVISNWLQKWSEFLAKLNYNRLLFSLCLKLSFSISCTLYKLYIYRIYVSNDSTSFDLLCGITRTTRTKLEHLKNYEIGIYLLFWVLLWWDNLFLQEMLINQVVFEEILGCSSNSCNTFQVRQFHGI